MEQQLQTTHPAGMLLLDHYLVEDLLGRGGFGAVYLVRDQRTGEMAALKELSERNESEKQRLLAECEILQRLNHPSLPQVQGVFEQDEHMYMHMEYIAGPNLEILRKRQPEQRFSFPEVVELIGPIVEAVTYLHQQHPPLMHRDIKPANIIVPESGARTTLVDFGIAKEYHADATTTAIRHCSPGYSAPEQYSSMGTDPRVDVYGLGATCYTLLTGQPPVDALQRMTRIASKKPDPLVMVSELAPDLPRGAAAAIQSSLAINYERRFPTPAAFWQAFTGEAPFSESDRATPGSLPAISIRQVKAKRVVSRPLRARPSTSFSGKTRFILVLLLAPLVTASLAGFWLYKLNINAPLAHSTPRLTPSHSTAVTAEARNYPLLVSTYSGMLDNLLTHTTVNISLRNVQQSAQSFKGNFTEANTRRNFAGVVDAAKHLLFTVAAQAGQPAIFFEGTIRDDGYLVGNYCSVDASGQCSGGEYGLWSLAPA